MIYFMPTAVIAAFQGKNDPESIGMIEVSFHHASVVRIWGFLSVNSNANKLKNSYTFCTSHNHA